jgi:hypothetical protein
VAYLAAVNLACSVTVLVWIFTSHGDKRALEYCLLDALRDVATLRAELQEQSVALKEIVGLLREFHGHPPCSSAGGGGDT